MWKSGGRVWFSLPPAKRFFGGSPEARRLVCVMFSGFTRSCEDREGSSCQSLEAGGLGFAILRFGLWQ